VGSSDCNVCHLEGLPLLGEGFVGGASTPCRVCRAYGFEVRGWVVANIDSNNWPSSSVEGLKQLV
jgi:hypothetical protein